MPSDDIADPGHGRDAGPGGLRYRTKDDTIMA